jgi:hypothetical protein
MYNLNEIYQSLKSKEKRDLPTAINKKALFSERVHAGSRIYFFDVKEAIDGTKYLVIDESRHSEGDSYTHNRVMVFEDNVAKFMEGLTKAVNAITNQEH